MGVSYAWRVHASAAYIWKENGGVEMSEHVFHSHDDPTAAESTSKISAVTRTVFDAPYKLRGIDADDIAAIDALPATSALLIARRGPNAGARFLLNSDEVVAGRHPRSDIFLDDVTVSRRHASFLRSENGFIITDAGSLNGTYVNGELVESVALLDGDEVRIGKYQFTFFMSPQVK